MSKHKKAKELIPLTARQCKVDTEVVNDVVDHFYSTFRKKLESCEDHRVSLPVLGTFRIRRMALKKSIEKLKLLIQKSKPENFKGVLVDKRYKEMLEKQESLLQDLKNTEHEKTEFKKNMGASISNS